jgi:hypothetical protein
VLAILAVRVYRARRGKPLRFLMLACIVYVLPGVGWFLFYSIRAGLSYRMLSSAHPEVLSWQAGSELAFQILFMALMLCSLISFLRGGRSDATPQV